MYSVDASALITAENDLYPHQNFPQFWTQVQNLVNQGRFHIVKAVHIELGRKDDHLKKWVDMHSQMVMSTNAKVENIVREIINKYPGLVVGHENEADPHVVAYAKEMGFKVVTQERRRGSADRPKIPVLCRQHGVTAITCLEMIKEQNWVF
ncbi:MAG: DUF4411 family protein [Vulcanimicrobiota bacterium]